ncbi:hypothetical protein TNCV_3759761 [Trichonephila clavipes]|nr:hypothetical protein TNCV_3759761 [Trichonephila clavipes]
MPSSSLILGLPWIVRERMFWKRSQIVKVQQLWACALMEFGVWCEDDWVKITREIVDRPCVGVTQAAGYYKIDGAVSAISPGGDPRRLRWGCDRETAVPSKLVESGSCCLWSGVLFPCLVLGVVITHYKTFRSVFENL